MSIKKIISGLLLLIITLPSTGQNLIWYFGSTLNLDPSLGWVVSSYGLDFTTGTPVQKNLESAIGYYESVSVVSDQLGNVLYYSDGIEVYDASHQLMVGMPGAGLQGTNHGVTASSVQGAFSVLKPGSLTEYYLFTSSSVESSTGFRVNRIDLSKQGNALPGAPPLGEMVTVDSLLYGSSAEMMTAYGVCGSDSVWIITHERASNNFIRVLLTSAGIQSVTTQNFATPNGGNSGFLGSAIARGSMDINADGTKLVFTGQSPIGTHLLDFDKTTGLVSNNVELIGPDGFSYYGYGSEFSPDGTKIYLASNLLLTGMWQHEISTGSAEILNGTVGLKHGEIITGVDDKIYVGKPNQSALHTIGVMSSPNAKAGGGLVNYNPSGINFGAVSGGQSVSYAMPQGFFCPLVLECDIDSVAEVCSTDPSFQFTANRAGDWGGGAYINITGTFDPSVAGVGTHWVTFDGGCTEPDSVQMVVILCCPNIDPNLGANTTICDDVTVTLDAGLGLTTYEWKENGVVMSGTGSTIVADSGTYIVNVTDGAGCTGTDTIEIGNFQLPVVNLGPADSYCATDSIQLDAGSFASYVWTPNGETSQQIWASSATTYTVTVTDGNGCEGTDNVVITEDALPTPSVTGNTIVCQDSTTLITGVAGSGGTLAWSGITPFTNPLAVTTAGTYTIIETDGNGCIDSADYTLTLENLPSVNLGGPYVFCDTQGNQVLDANTGGANETYVWSDGSSNSTLNVTTASTVSVIVTSENGCIALDTAILTTHSLPVVNLGPDTFFCGTDSFQLDAGSFTSYSWTPNGETSQQIWATAPATYIVTVTDGNGCENTDTVIISQSTLPTPSVTGNIIVCQDSTTLITGVAGSGGTLAWSGITPFTNPLAVTAAGTYTIIETDAVGCVDSADYTLTLENSPSVNLGGPYVFCDTQGNQVLDANTGGANETYVWSDGSSNSTLNVTTASTVSVIVTSENGCIALDTAILTTHSLPVVNLGPDTFFCTLDSFQLDAGVFASYVWTPNVGTGQTVYASSAGNYAVTVTDANGCTATDDVDITQSALPVVGLNPTASYCVGDSVELDAGSGFVSYAWTPNSETTQSVFASTSGQYSVVVVDANGCVGVDTVAVSEVTSLPVDLGVDTFYCEFDSVRLDVVSGYTTYDWTPNISTTETGYAKSVGTYSIIVTDAAGCKGWDTVEVSMRSIPVVNLGPDTFYCEADSFLLDAGAGFSNYAWTPNVGSGQTVYANSQTNYSVTVTDANGCTATSDVDITENALPTINLGADTTVCEADSITLDATHVDAASYAWTPNSETQASIKVGSSSATYGVTVTDVDGCTFTDSRTISQDVLPVVNLGSNDTICDNLTKTLDATAGFSYVWYLDGNVMSDTTQTIDADSGTYVVSITTALGCEARDTILLDNHQLPVVSFGSTFEFCELDSVQLDAGNSTSTYSWSPTNETTQTIWAKLPGTYKATVTDTNGCVNAGDATVIENSIPVVNLGANDSACIGLTIILDATVPNGVTYDWSDGHNQSTYTITNPDTLSVIVTDADGCIGYDTIEIKMLQQLNLQFDDTTTECANDILDLDAGDYAGGVYTWTLPDGSIDNSQIIALNDSGWYVLNITDQYNCQGADSIFVIIVPVPNIDLGPDTAFCSLGQDTYTVQMVFSENIPGTISWSENNNNSNDSLFTATYTPITIIGTFLDNLTCSHIDTVELTEFCEPTEIIMPNIFVPGGTDNPTFHPIGIDDNTFNDIVNNIVTSKFEVYNRWGLKVFQSDDLLPRWNGNYENRPAASGTYYWIYTYTDSSLKEYKLNGFVQLIQAR